MSKQKTIKVCIVEDTIAINDNLKSYFDFFDDFEIVHSSYSIEDFLHFLAQHKAYTCDIILLDIGLPGMSGIEGIPLIKEKLPITNIIMLTTYDDERTILNALCQGAVGYISKKTSLENIVKAVRIVYEGGSYMSPSIAREIIQHLVHGSSNPQSQKNKILTARQTDILELLVNGNSYSTVAAKLFISIETVKSHIKNIYKQLNVNNKAGAIRKYLQGKI